MSRATGPDLVTDRWPLGSQTSVSVTRRRVRRLIPKVAEYVKAGDALTPQERLEAARLLRLSVDQDEGADQAEIDAAWRDEVGRRLEDVLEGRVELAEADETHRMLSAELASKRG